MRILQGALESHDMYQRCRAEVAATGPTLTNPDTGMVRANPAAKLARDFLSEFRAGLKQLGLQPFE